jgi:predicted Zn-dependent peptidase
MWLVALSAWGSIEVARLSNGIPVVYERDGGAGNVTLAAVVRTDDLTPRELDAIEGLVDSWHGGTESLTLHRMSVLAGQSGGRIVVAQAADCVRFDATVPRESFALVLTLLSELFLRPQISAETIRIGREQRRRAAPIAEHPLEHGVRALLSAAGLSGSGAPTDAPEEVEAAWRKAFRPERVAIGVIGDVPLEEVVQRVGASLGSWQPPAPNAGPRRQPRGAAPPPTARYPVVGVLLAGPGPGDAQFPAFLVGLTALLDGKGSIVGREFRYARSLAYELGLLRFVRSGQLWALFYASGGEASAVETALSLVRSGASKITEDELERARTYLVSRLRYGYGGGSLLSSLSGAAVEPIERAHRYAWLQAFGFKGAIEPDLAQGIVSVRLADVREAIGAAVNGARALAAEVTRGQH